MSRTSPTSQRYTFGAPPPSPRSTRSTSTRSRRAPSANTHHSRSPTPHPRLPPSPRQRPPYPYTRAASPARSESSESSFGHIAHGRPGCCFDTRFCPRLWFEEEVFDWRGVDIAQLVKSAAATEQGSRDSVRFGQMKDGPLIDEPLPRNWHERQEAYALQALYERQKQHEKRVQDMRLFQDKLKHEQEMRRQEVYSQPLDSRGHDQQPSSSEKSSYPDASRNGSGTGSQNGWPTHSITPPSDDESDEEDTFFGQMSLLDEHIAQVKPSRKERQRLKKQRKQEEKRKSLQQKRNSLHERDIPSPLQIMHERPTRDRSKRLSWNSGIGRDSPVLQRLRQLPDPVPSPGYQRARQLEPSLLPAPLPSLRQTTQPTPPPQPQSQWAEPPRPPVVLAPPPRPPRRARTPTQCDTHDYDCSCCPPPIPMASRPKSRQSTHKPQETSEAIHHLLDPLPPIEALDITWIPRRPSIKVSSRTAYTVPSTEPIPSLPVPTSPSVAVEAAASNTLSMATFQPSPRAPLASIAECNSSNSSIYSTHTAHTASDMNDANSTSLSDAVGSMLDHHRCPQHPQARVHNSILDPFPEDDDIDIAWIPPVAPFAVNGRAREPLSSITEYQSSTSSVYSTQTLSEPSEFKTGLPDMPNYSSLWAYMQEGFGSDTEGEGGRARLGGHI